MGLVNDAFDIVYLHWTSPRFATFWQQDIQILSTYVEKWTVPRLGVSSAGGLALWESVNVRRAPNTKL